MKKTWKPEPELLASLDAAVPEILASQKENGQFGTEPWISTDQNVLLSLAAAWHLESSRYHHDGAVLDAIVRGGDALIEAQDEEGKFIFRKKDHSTWGQIYQPWIYSRWVRAYEIVRDAVEDETRERWDAALRKGYEGISSTAMERIHNIPAHHAMGLYVAGKVFERADWKRQARDFLHQVAAAQSPHGWWPEHKGPVVSYNFVYTEALGVYYAVSGDEGVLEALERASRYHANFTYPDGSAVETIDGRNPYHKGARLRSPGFSHSAMGRGYLAYQHARHLETGEAFPADYAAHLLLYGGEGPVEEAPSGRDRHLYRMGEEAMTLRRKPWFICLSAFLAEIPQNRWGQDRQNFVSVFHDRAGVILGGGNTKLQPLWSSFTVGDPSLLSHTPGDEAPDFRPREGLIHVPDRAQIEADEEAPGVVLHYGPETCRVGLYPQGEAVLGIVCEASANSGMPVEGHLTLLPDLDRPVELSTGDRIPLGEAPFSWSAPENGGFVAQGPWRLIVPRGARLVWPALPHNPYRKGGETTVEEARLAVVLSFSREVSRYELALQVG